LGPFDAFRVAYSRGGSALGADLACIHGAEV